MNYEDLFLRVHYLRLRHNESLRPESAGSCFTTLALNASLTNKR